MSYANSAVLKMDTVFYGRVDACCTEQAQVFINDEDDPAVVSLAEAQLRSGMATAGMLPIVCTAPGFGDAADQESIEDGQILAAVQAVWPMYADLVFPPPGTELEELEESGESGQ